MHKEIIICLIIIIVIISFDLLTKNFTKDTTETINGKLQELKVKLVDEELSKDEVYSLNQDIMKEWKKKYEVLAYYIEHDELEKVETELTSLEASIEVEQFEDGIENLDRCIFILNHIKDKYVLNMKNIF